MKDFKLNIDLLPKGAWGNDFSRTLSQKDWDILKNKCYEKANRRCQICGLLTDGLNAHEVWDFNIDNKTQTLKDIVALCSKCHGVIHYRNSERLGYGENAKQHFIKVNNATEIDFASHLANALIIFNERNAVYRWRIIADLSKFGGDDITIHEHYIPRIKNNYKIEELENLKNVADLNPRLIELEVDNYRGEIRIICDKTNKIVWYDNNNKAICTKFNFAKIFKTSFSVKDLTCNYITFNLVGEKGMLLSKKIYLEKWD